VGANRESARMGLVAMFIRSLTLSNILSFREPGPLVLQPLNVVIGANASGKSNLIDCIGLLRALPGSANNYK
jgi:AAA15 family ATPase/GTPase